MDMATLTGKYVVAVSGGIDSVALLNILVKQKNNNHQLDLVVAHFNHQIREDSDKDKEFVKSLASSYDLEFFSADGHLGGEASEQAARAARYSFLDDVLKKTNSSAIITAHHQDDLIETAILNIIRGTGRRGLSSLTSNARVVRPLLKFTKQELSDYAHANNLKWHEDPTNLDTKYLRNYIRHNIVAKLSEQTKVVLIDHIRSGTRLNESIDKQLEIILADQKQLPRLWLNSLDSAISREVIMAWLRQNGLYNYDRKMINRLASTLKTMQPTKEIDVYQGWKVRATKDYLALEHRER